MKYGQAYQAALANNDFPTSWVSAAVSYRALKKCIKQIQTELDNLGLDPETLKSLDSSFGVSRTSGGLDDEPLEGTFTPELWVAVDARTGHFLHAGLTDSTKSYLHSVKSSPDLKRRLSFDQAAGSDKQVDSVTTPDSDKEEPPSVDLDTPGQAEVVWKQVPLATVNNFFGSLEPALSGLQTIQETEAANLRSRIIELRQNLTLATSPPPLAKAKAVKASKNDLEIWRKLFELYTETPIFFSTHERDHGSRPYDIAKAQMQLFSDRLVQADLVKRFRNPTSRVALENFIAINLDILRILHFEEMNAQAVRKILKKFDKRTHLSASKTFQGPRTSRTLAKSIAHDMCAEIATNVLAVVPCIDDYLCPVCCELAWKPVKLGCCNAVFCIRCIIQLQKDQEPRCPMCRTSSVVEADASRIDKETIEHLQKYFPKDVKAKQAANERAAGIDQYGVNFYRRTCVVT